MLKLFDPQTKVQKDRQIIKDTDLRMAKYSRRGIISNFLIYVLCLVVEGTFLREHQNLSIVLTSGLLLVTIIRGYFLFRLDVIYPRGPEAWRNKYFLATLLGACWWGVILASFTLHLGMNGEASLMWLYTVVFFSTTAHAFAPYKRFLSAYQFIGLVPASCCTFFIGEYVGAFYGFILLLFYVILNHHCALMSLNYWERLEAQYILAKKSVSLEEERRDTRASVQLTNEFIQVLRLKLQSFIEGEEFSGSSLNSLQKLYKNVDDFRRVVSKDLDTTESVFNVRHLIQSLVRSAMSESEQHGLELESSLSPALPARMEGDARHLSRLLSIVMHSTLNISKQCTLFIDAEFVRNYEDSGDLVVTVSRQGAYSKRTLFQSDENPTLALTLPLVLAKGLAEQLGGSLDVDELGGVEGKYLTLRCPLRLAEVGARPEYHRLAYKGRPLLLIHQNQHILNLKRLELEAMGFDVQTSDDFKAAFQVLKGALASGSAIQSVVYNTAPESEDSVRFCNELLEHNELKYIHQFIVCSPVGRLFFSTRTVVQSAQIHYVGKPAGFFEFESAFCCVFEETDYLDSVSESGTAIPDSEKDSVLWFDLKKVFEHANLYKTDKVNIECVSDLKVLIKHISEAKAKMLVVEFSDQESIDCIQVVRAEEKSLGLESLIPIVAIGPEVLELSMLEGGVDHFIDLKCFIRDELPELGFWISGSHH